MDFNLIAELDNGVPYVHERKLLHEADSFFCYSSSYVSFVVEVYIVDKLLFMKCPEKI